MGHTHKNTLNNNTCSACSMHLTRLCRVEVGLRHQYLQLSEGTKVPSRVAVEQVVFLIYWEVAETTVLGIQSTVEIGLHRFPQKSALIKATQE